MATFKEALEYSANNPNSEFAKAFGKEVATGRHDEEAKNFGIDTTPIKQQFGFKEQKPQGEKGIKGVAVGVGKGVLSTVKGVGQLGEKIGNLVLPKSMESQSVYSDEATKGGLLDKENLKAQGTAEKLGKGIEQIAEFAIPGSAVSKATKGASLVSKIGSRALTSGTVASVQAGEVGKDALIAGAVETALPIAGKVLSPATKIVSRLFKGLGSGLSGVGTETIDQIVKNPKTASATVKGLTTGGNASILKKNAETVINGVAGIKRSARKAFGEGLESLQQTDIDNKIFRESTQSVLDKYGSKSVVSNNKFNKFVKTGELPIKAKRELTNIEFDDPKNIKKAKDLINRLETTKLDGKSLRKLIDDIENSAYKIATTDERLSFNAFVKDLAGSLKSGISKSTSKLDDINKAFSTDMQLAESIEKIFGKVKFQNASEINKVSQQLESLFSKKGLSPEYIDNFLNRIGIKPDDFKTTEAVRQISNKVTGANTKGLSLGELTQQVTSSVITPKLVRDVAIYTGKSEKVIKTLLENTAPAMRATLIEGLTPKN